MNSNENSERIPETDCIKQRKRIPGVRCGYCEYKGHCETAYPIEYINKQMAALNDAINTHKNNCKED